MSSLPDIVSKLTRGFSLPVALIATLAIAGNAFAAETGSLYSAAKLSNHANSLDDFDLTADPESATSGNPEDEKSKIFPAIWCTDIDDQTTKNSCWAAYRNGLDYYEFGLNHRKSVLKWQHISTQIILVVVLILVAMGLYFAWEQFKAGTGEQTSTEIEISSASIKISSPVLGVIILVVSLAFFYLYLIYVYPIEEVI